MNDLGIRIAIKDDGLLWIELINLTRTSPFNIIASDSITRDQLREFLGLSNFDAEPHTGYDEPF